MVVMGRRIFAGREEEDGCNVGNRVVGSRQETANKIGAINQTHASQVDDFNSMTCIWKSRFASLGPP